MIPQRSQLEILKWYATVGAPRLVIGDASGSPSGDLCYHIRSWCPLGYNPSEHRKVESVLILPCCIHWAYSQVDISYDYELPLHTREHGQVAHMATEG